MTTDLIAALSKDVDDLMVVARRMGYAKKKGHRSDPEFEARTWRIGSRQAVNMQEP